ncbi:MAG: NAD(P)-dependent oxidoreductase [Pseudomonadota bacterium]
MKVMRPLPPADLEYILARSENLWQELSGERLFITGGTGFFGVWLLEAITAANSRLNARVDVSILSRSPERFVALHPHLAASCTWIKGDIRNFDFPQGEFGHIIHAATSTDARFNAEKPGEALDTILGGTHRVLEFAARAKTHNLLFTSSGAVYGAQPPSLSSIPEDYSGGPDITDADSVYAEGKRLAELQLAIASNDSGLQGKIARCFAFVGPHLPLDWHFAIGNFMRDAMAHKEIVIRGDGRPQRSYLHAADLTIWLFTILLRGQNMRPYNVGSDEACSIADLAQRVARLSGQPGKVRILTPEDSSPAPRYVPNTTRARDELGLNETIPLDDSIARTLSWLKANT